LAIAGTPCVPYAPTCPHQFNSEELSPQIEVLFPLIHAHCWVDGLNSQRSYWSLAEKSLLSQKIEPRPPKSQKLPSLSVQPMAPTRLPGLMFGANTPSVP